MTPVLAWSSVADIVSAPFPAQYCANNNDSKRTGCQG
jgi:hypothetical protein